MDLKIIKTVLTDQLKTRFPEIAILDTELVEGENRPSFFIEFQEVKDTLQTKNFYCRNILVAINYYPEENKNLENLIMVDKLKEIFWPYIQIIDRKITVQEFKAKMLEQNSKLKFTFNLIFEDEVPNQKSEDYELIQEVVINNSLEEE